MVAHQQQQDNASSGSAMSFTLQAGATSGDLVLAIGSNDFYDTTHLTTPTGTAIGGGWTLRFTGDGGTNDNHVKVWTGAVSNTGGTIVEGTSSPNDEERYFGYWVIPSATWGTAASTDVDADPNSGNHVAPSVTPTTGKTDDLLICLFTSLNAGDYTAAPSGMTFHTERDIAGVVTSRAAYQTLSSDAATGTRTATFSDIHARPYTTSILIESTGGGGGTTAIPGRPQSYVSRRRAANW